MDIKTVKTELNKNSMTFHAVIYDEIIPKTRELVLLGEKREVSFNETSTLDNGQKFKITIDISDKTFEIFNKVWDNDFIIEALVLTSKQQTSSKNNLLSGKNLIFNLDKLNVGKNNETRWKYSYTTVEVNEYRLLKFFEEKFKEKYINHHVYLQGVENISIYKDFDKNMLGGVTRNNLNHIHLYGMGAKLDLETGIYFQEQEKYWDSYTSLGFVNRAIEIQDIKESDIEIIPLKEYIKREIDKFNNG